MGMGRQIAAGNEEVDEKGEEVEVGGYGKWNIGGGEW